MITLRDITMDNFYEVIKLELDDIDRQMVASNMFSLAEAYADKVSQPKAIYHNGTLVGFIMYDYNQPEQRGYVSRLMVAQQYQGKGYAKTAMQIVIGTLKQEPDIKQIQISYHPQNVKARSLYLQLGFIENGKFVDEEVVAVIDL